MTDRYVYWMSESRNAGAVEFHGWTALGGSWWGRCVSCGNVDGCEFWWPQDRGNHWTPEEAEPLRFAWINGRGPHCFTCHANGHTSCRMCGNCIFRIVGAHDFRRAHKRVEGARVDRAYCSPACRQKAYRRRRAADV